MINIAVIEDNDVDAKFLREYIDKYFSEAGGDYNVSRYSSGIAFLEKYNTRFDIIFMDIEMPSMNGMEVSRRVREIDREVIIIFVTNMAQLAIRGYEVQAFDFTVKPLSYDDFAMKLRVAIEHLNTRNDVKLVLPSKQGMSVVLASRVKYVEVMNHSLTFHTLDGEVSAYGSLKKYESQLNSAHFSRCNSCYFVNLKYVTGVTGFTAHVGGDDLQISANKRKPFLRDIANYLGAGA